MIFNGNSLLLINYNQNSITILVSEGKNPLSGLEEVYIKINPLCGHLDRDDREVYFERNPLCGLDDICGYEFSHVYFAFKRVHYYEMSSAQISNYTLAI